MGRRRRHHKTDRARVRLGAEDPRKWDSAHFYIGLFTWRKGLPRASEGSKGVSGLGSVCCETITDGRSSFWLSARPRRQRFAPGFVIRTVLIRWHATGLLGSVAADRLLFRVGCQAHRQARTRACAFGEKQSRTGRLCLVACDVWVPRYALGA